MERKEAMRSSLRLTGSVITALGCVWSSWICAVDVTGPGKDGDQIPESPAKPEERNGLEMGTWVAETFGNALDVEVVKPKGHEANALLKLDYLGGRSEKAVVRQLVQFALAEKGKLLCLVYCAEKDPPKFAVALCTGDAFLWQESEALALKQGWNEVSLDLDAKKWKSQASGWKNEAELVGREDLRAIELLVFNGKNGGAVFVDALHLDRDEKVMQKLQEWVKKLGSEEFEVREAAEKALVMAGRQALEELKKAAAGSDPEVAQRAKRVLDRIAGKLAKNQESDPALAGEKSAIGIMVRPPVPIAPQGQVKVGEKEESKK